jgi:hypothetical protein
MITIHFPFEELTQLSRKTRERMVSERPRLMEKMGGRLRQLIVESYERRAAGGTDVGITWQALTPAYLRRKGRRGLSEKIGIATRRLVESLEIDEESGRLHATFTADHAVAFDKLRKLLPDQLPGHWQEALEQEAIEWADEILVTNFEDDVPF